MFLYQAANILFITEDIIVPSLYALIKKTSFHVILFLLLLSSAISLISFVILSLFSTCFVSKSNTK